MELIQQLLFALIVAVPAAYSGYLHGRSRAEQSWRRLRLTYARHVARRLRERIRMYALEHDQVRLSDVLRIIDETVPPAEPPPEAAPPEVPVPPKAGGQTERRLRADGAGQSDLAAIVRAFFWGR